MLRPTATAYAFAACDLDATIADICQAAMEMFADEEPPTERVPSFGTETRKVARYEIPPEAYRDAG